MPTANRIMVEINDRVRRLVEVGLADRFQYGFLRRVGRRAEITFPNAAHISWSLKAVEYADVYRRLVHEGTYNVKMLDGTVSGSSVGNHPSCRRPSSAPDCRAPPAHGATVRSLPCRGNGARANSVWWSGRTRRRRRPQRPADALRRVRCPACAVCGLRLAGRWSPRRRTAVDSPPERARIRSRRFRRRTPRAGSASASGCRTAARPVRPARRRSVAATGRPAPPACETGR